MLKAIAKIDTLSVLKRYANNPIITPDDVPYPALTSYNAGAIKHDGKYLLLVRTDQNEGATSCVGLATSEDGIHFEFEPEPVMTPQEGDGARIYDPRITKIDDTYYVCHAITSAWGIRLAISSTKDFKTFTRISDSLPDNRNGVLFPERFDGLYLRLERPMPLYNIHYPYSTMNIWMSYSPDLEFWGRSKLVLEARHCKWAQHKIGPAAVPIRTEQGWLTIFHGVEMTDDNRKIYRLGCMLLDLKDPSKVIGIADGPILQPEEEFERKGYIDNVVFLCGVIPEDNGELKIYYAAADKYVCLATTTIDELVAICEPVKSD